MTTANPRVQLIQSQKELNDAVRKLSGAAEIAVDTESDSLFVYFEKVCLIQFSAEGHNYIIDPFEVTDLSVLGELFASPKILKIFHAGEYDLICLKRDYGFEFANLFDTMIAARMLNKPAIGLGALVEAEFGVHLEKKYQKANWGIRPIPREMLRYAVQDTLFLSELKERLRNELCEKNLMDFAEEDFLRLCATPAGSSEPAETNWWRVAGNMELLPTEAGVLQKLCDMRDLFARRRDLPPFKILSNQALLDIAITMPRGEYALRGINGLNANLIRRYGKDILRAVQLGRTSKNAPSPRQQPKPPNGILQRRDRLKEWRKQTGIAFSLPSDVILPKDVLNALATEAPKTEADLQSLMADVPVRYKHFHREILQVCLDDSDEE